MVREFSSGVGIAFAFCPVVTKRVLSQKAKLSNDFSTVELAALLSLGLTS